MVLSQSAITKEVLCIDIDGVIAEIAENYYEALLVPGAREALDYLKENYLIYLHTGRHLNHATDTIKWLKDNNVYYDHIVFGKPPAIMYIDDRGERFKSWKSILKRVKQLESIQKTNTK